MAKKTNKTPPKEKKTKKIVKKQKKQDSNIADKELILTKTNNMRTIKVQFPYIAIQYGKKKLAYSVANRDGLFYTPLFILPDESTSYQQKQHQKIHKQRVLIEDNQIDVRQIQIPKPSVRNSYCTICKKRFQDYLNHIKDPEHGYRMRLSDYNQFIKELCYKYSGGPRQETQIETGKETGKADQSTYYNSIINPFEQVESINKQQFLMDDGDKSKMYQKLRDYVNKEDKEQNQLFNVLA